LQSTPAWIATKPPPFFVIDRRYGISGAQPAEAITQVLDKAWADSQ
jgi:predicted DsbA family dithiol-disulfide isomerase